MCSQKIRALSYLGAEKITFPPKPNGQTDRNTDGRTDISIYGVASLLKIRKYTSYRVAAVLKKQKSKECV